MGALVPGTTAKFVVVPAESVRRNAKASENVHSKLPISYSSEAIKNSKLILSAKGTKSNWIYVALFEVIPTALFKSASPSQSKEPEL